MKLHPYAEVLLGAYRGPVVSWKDEGRYGDARFYPSVEAFSDSLASSSPQLDSVVILGWMTRAQAKTVARHRQACLVTF